MSWERLSDLNDLALSCRTEQARLHAREAIACYEGGAYRACIVLTWIATVFDVVDKVREMNASGYAEAKSQWATFEAIQVQIDKGDPKALLKALEFERDILLLAKDKLQLISHQQYTDLDRLREDRHRCAHPSFHDVNEPYRPSAELARTHLRNAIVHLLQQPPIQGKAAIEGLKALVGSNYFPSNPQKARQQLETAGLARPTEALIRGFLDAMVFDFFTDGRPLKHSQNVIVAIGAVLDMHRAIAEPRLQLQISKIAITHPDKDYLGVVWFVVDAGVWGLLDQPAQDKIKGFVENGPVQEVIAILDRAGNIGALKASAKSRINQLNKDELASAVRDYALGAVAVDRAIELYGEAGSWASANDLADNLVMPLLEYLSEASIEKIIRLPADTGADLVGSHGFTKILGKIRSEGIMDPKRLDAILRANNLSGLASDHDSEAGS